jgi:signal transduction histidine kinase
VDGASALLDVLARALDLERAALLLATSNGTLDAIATLGRVSPKMLAEDALGRGTWTVTVPLECDGRIVGRLLASRRGNRPLPPADRRLLERLAASAAEFIAQRRAQSDLDHTRELLARAETLSALGTLAAGVAHEIRNPLVSVRTFIQLLPERMDDEEFRTGFRDLALTEIERICALINDLLAFSRPSPSQLEPTDLVGLAAQTVRLLDAEARKHGVHLTCDLPETLPAVHADEARVKQVLMNVVLNAVQAAPPHTTVEVTAHADGDRTVLEVADRGPGIPPEQVRQIFDPFFTTKASGSGLGLFIAERIVRDHGGTIEPRPREGGGTVFALVFPSGAPGGAEEHVDAG